MFLALILLTGILIVLVEMCRDAREYHKRGIKHMEKMEDGKDRLLLDLLPHITVALDKAANLDVIPEIEQEN